ncbi:MAG: DUF1015 domain-containing protein [Oscillospiraceae bacterium]|jgi:uncharacterized protein (DUF1015 family)|nr:DUF1015 domain-containing protein [Oscillospiraceae bacterium]
MAYIAPFRALRYDTDRAGELGELCCPPYDIISPVGQAALEAQSPYNVIRLERPLGEDRYRRAGETLRRWLSDGILRRDGDPAYYVCRMDFAEGGAPRSVYGFFARVGLEPFGQGSVLPHEETLSKDKSDRFSLMEQTFCNISPIYGLYSDPTGGADARLRAAMSAPPESAFTDGDGVTHSLWTVTDPIAQAALTGALADRRIYLADGHHRYETALSFFEAKRRSHVPLAGDPLGGVLMMLVALDHPGLVVWPTHRLVHGLPDFDPNALTAALAEDFTVTPCLAEPEALAAALAASPRTVGLYSGGPAALLLTLRNPEAIRQALPHKSDAYRALEVSLLHALILEPRLGIGRAQLADQTYLTYTRSLPEALDGVRGGGHQCAFLLPSTPVPMIGTVADAGERMPQKSTYFYPKLATGLVINPLDD